MLAFLVFKIEYRRALRQNGIPAPCRPISSNFPSVDPTSPDGIYAERVREESFSPKTKPSISSFAPTFLSGTAQYIETSVTHSKQTTATFLPGARTAHLRPGRFSGIACQPARLERLFRTSQAAFRETSVYSTAFLTGSASHSKTSVTHSKQTTEIFLTGSRIARGEKRTINLANPKLRAVLVLLTIL